jgi:hypothetical protein
MNHSVYRQDNTMDFVVSSANLNLNQNQQQPQFRGLFVLGDEFVSDDERQRRQERQKKIDDDNRRGIQQIRRCERLESCMTRTIFVLTALSVTLVLLWFVASFAFTVTVMVYGFAANFERLPVYYEQWYENELLTQPICRIIVGKSRSTRGRWSDLLYVRDVCPFPEGTTHVWASLMNQGNSNDHCPVDTIYRNIGNTTMTMTNMLGESCERCVSTVYKESEARHGDLHSKVSSDGRIILQMTNNERVIERGCDRGVVIWQSDPNVNNVGVLFTLAIISIFTFFGQIFMSVWVCVVMDFYATTSAANREGRVFVVPGLLLFLFVATNTAFFGVLLSKLRFY